MPRPALIRRPARSAAWTLAAPVLAVILTLLVGGIVFGLLRGLDAELRAAFEAGEIGRAALIRGQVGVVLAHAAETIRVIFWDPLFHPDVGGYLRGQLLVKAGPLILIAIGLSLGFRAGVWNIGAEGQYIIGALAGAGFGLAFHDYAAERPFWLSLAPSTSPLVFLGMVMFGLLGGVLWAMIPALLRVYARTNEILVSLLLVYVAEKILASAATGWLRDPDGRGFPGSRNLSRHDGTGNPELIAGSGMHWGVVAAFVAVIAAYVILSRHMFGYHVRLAGQSPRAARLAGVNPARMVIVCLGLSGALAGAAGLFEVAGPAGQISIDFNVGYGFTAIIVAFLGRLHPVGILAAGLLMALTYVGGNLAETRLQVPASAIQMVQGLLLFFLLALDVLSGYRVAWRGGSAGAAAAA